MSDSTRDLRVADSADGAPDLNTNPTLRAEAAATPDPGAATLGGDTPPGYTHSVGPVQFPGYQILGELGRGGMGVVYKARQTRLNRSVALKVILAGPHASSEDKARFRIEAEAVARLRQPNIVQVYDVGAHEGFEYIALELVEGDNLRRWQNGNPIEPKLAAQLAVGIGRAIQHAHENGILHRDIKPANILLARDRSHEAGDTKNSSRKSKSSTSAACPLIPKVTDFGLAKPIEGGQDLTITGMACGTPNYMAPELVRGKKPIGPAVDVYSFGAVLYELLAGRPPFAGMTGAEVLDAILRSDPPPVRRVNPRVPRDLCVIAEKCIEKEPARRYPSAAAAVEDLENYLDGRPIRARAVGRVERAVRWGRRNPVAAMFLAVTTVGCAVTGTLAVALANSVRVERSARSDAETARDQLQTALDAAETAKAAAVEQKTQADAERKRAVSSFKLARAAIRSTLEQLGNHPRIKEPDFRDFRTCLIRLTSELRVQLAAQADNDADALGDLGGVAHWTGYLEYRNGNMTAAAEHYLAAADAFRRMSEVDRDDPTPRARQAHSLTNAANAFYHARKFADSETQHREAIRILEEVTARHPHADYHVQHVRSYAPLFEVLREQGRWDDAELLCRKYIPLARELVRHVAGIVANDLTRITADVLLANALQSQGQVLVRTGNLDAGEKCLLESLQVRDRIVSGTKGQPGHVVDAVRGRFVVAEHFAERGRNDLAVSHYGRASAITEAALKASPGTPQLMLASADTAVVLADVLRRGGNFKAAEPLFDRAIGRMEELTRQPLDAGDSRHARDIRVRAMVGRAHLLNHTNRHKDAVALWGRLAEEDPSPNARWEHRMCVLFSHLFDGNRTAAIAGAEKHALVGEKPAWVWCDLAKVWCKAAALASADPELAPADRAAEAERAFVKAVELLGRAKSAGLFQDSKKVERFAADRDFDPIRDRFDPRP